MKAKRRTSKAPGTRSNSRQNEDKKRILDELATKGFNVDLLHDQSVANLTRKLEKYNRGEIVNDTTLSNVNATIVDNVISIEQHYTIPKCYDALDNEKNEKTVLYREACKGILTDEEIAMCRNSVYDAIMTDNDIVYAKISITVSNVFDGACVASESSLLFGDQNLYPVSSYSKTALEDYTKVLTDKPTYKLLLLTRPPKLTHASKSICDFIERFRDRIAPIGTF